MPAFTKGQGGEVTSVEYVLNKKCAGDSNVTGLPTVVARPTNNHF